MSDPSVPSPTDLAWYVQAVGPDDTDYAAQCSIEATELVESIVGTHEVPVSVVDRAVLEVGADLYHRKAARSGLVQFGGGTEAPAVHRIPLDPLRTAWPILRPYLPGGFA